VEAAVKPPPAFFEGEKCMAKAGMRRPGSDEPHGTESNKKNRKPKNDVTPVPEIQGKQKNK
jgi:hypothetical protein